MNQLRIFLFYCIFLFVNSIPYTYNDTPPKLTIIIVVDQCAFYYLQKLKKHFKYGMKRLMDYGVVYNNAHFPHAKPETATGHAALNTGTYAGYHGYIGNSWFDRKKGTIIKCDYDDHQDAMIFGNDEEGYGKSAQYLKVDGLSDRFVARTSKNDPYHVYSLSIKSRSAIAMAGHIREPLGSAFWFQDGKYTTSKAYAHIVPSWVQNYNKKIKIKPSDEIFWKPFYNPQCSAYELVKKDTYLFSQEPQFFNRKKRVDLFTHHEKDPYFWYEASPYAITDLFGLAQACINQNFLKNDCGHMLLWISMSGLDKLGHVFGPDSYETIDYLYHFDKALEDFLRYVKNEIGKRHFICIFTADHGASPLPEISALQGLPTKRISTDDLKKHINLTIEKKIGIKNIIAEINMPEIYINKNIFNTCKRDVQKNVLQEVYTILKFHEGIQWVWKTEALLSKEPQKGSFEDNFKKQIYPGRSGDFIVQPSPFYTFTDYKKGSNHGSPYNQDTHVPLIFYGPKYFTGKNVYEYVSMLQLAPTLSLMFGLEFPSASVKKPLPHIFTKDHLFDAF